MPYGIRPSNVRVCHFTTRALRVTIMVLTSGASFSTHPTGISSGRSGASPSQSRGHGVDFSMNHEAIHPCRVSLRPRRGPVLGFSGSNIWRHRVVPPTETNERLNSLAFLWSKFTRRPRPVPYEAKTPVPIVPIAPKRGGFFNLGLSVRRHGGVIARPWLDARPGESCLPDFSR